MIDTQETGKLTSLEGPEVPSAEGVIVLTCQRSQPTRQRCGFVPRWRRGWTEWFGWVALMHAAHTGRGDLTSVEASCASSSASVEHGVEVTLVSGAGDKGMDGVSSSSDETPRS